MAKENLDEEPTELSNLKVPEVSLVDKPAVGDATFLIFKNIALENNNKEVSKMVDVEKEKDDLEKDNLQKDTEPEKEMEKKEEDTKKAMSFEDAKKQAAGILKDCDISDEEDEQRKMLIGSLEGTNTTTKQIVVETEKAGRRVSKDTEKKIATVVGTLSKAIDELQSLYAKAKAELDDEDEEEVKPAKKSIEDEKVEIEQDEIDKFFQAVKEGHITKEEAASVISLLS